MNKMKQMLLLCDIEANASRNMHKNLEHLLCTRSKSICFTEKVEKVNATELMNKRLHLLLVEANASKKV